MARKLEVEIVGDASSLHRALKQSDTSTSKFGGTLSKLKYGAVAAGAAVGTGLVVGLEKSVHAAIEAQKVNARLEVAFKNAGLSAKAYAKQIEVAEKAGRRLGFSDEETKTSLGSLITSTKNYKQALRQMAIAQDLARFKGVDLEAATKALTMAHAGSLRPIKQLGIDVPKVTDAVDKLKSETKKHTGAIYDNALAAARLEDKQTTFAHVLSATTAAVHGQADAYSKTAAGAMEQFHAQLNHIEVAIGSKLLPIMTQAIAWIMKNWPAMSAAIEKAWKIQIKPALDAMIGLVIAVVTAIRTHWNTIGPIVRAVAEVIKTEIQIIVGVIKILTDILEGHWSKAWTDAKAVVGNVLHLIHAQIQEYAAVGGLIWKAVLALGSAIVKGLEAGITAVWKEFEGFVKHLFGEVIGWVKGVFGIKSPSTVFHDIGVNLVKGMISGVGASGGLLKKAVEGIAGSALSKLGGAVGGVLHGGAAHGNQANRNLGMKMAAAYGWGSGAEWVNLDALWNQESNWSNTARNKSSGAYGIPQALPPTKLPAAGQASGGSSAAAQIAWGLNYIKSRYGSPVAAEAHEQSVGWYDKGGVVPGSGPQLAVVHGGETIIPTHKKLSHHIDAIANTRVKWDDAIKRFMLWTSFGSKGIPTVRMERDWFNQWKGKGLSTAVLHQIIPWWEREGYFEQLASRKGMKSFDSGGWLNPGLTMAYNGTGRPERVVAPGGGGSAPIYLITPDGKALAEFVFDGMRGVAQVYRQRTGRPAFGS